MLSNIQKKKIVFRIMESKKDKDIYVLYTMRHDLNIRFLTRYIHFITIIFKMVDFTQFIILLYFSFYL